MILSARYYFIILISFLICSMANASNILKIMPLGDSLTEGGYNLNGVWYGEGGGYRLPLELRLLPSYPNLEFVGSQANGPSTMPQRNHEGHSGWRIEEISAKVVPWLQTYRPDVILLMIGSNNMWKDEYRKPAPGYFEKLLDQIEDTLPNTKVFVASIIPTNNVEVNLEVVNFNKAIRRIVAGKIKAGKPMIWVDMYHLAGITDSDLTDGVHPTGVGYSKMANVWYNYLNPLVADKSGHSK